MRDLIGRAWGAHATFVTDEAGAVDVQCQAPIAGSYTGVDPMGLIWAMTQLSGGAAPDMRDERLLPPARMTLTAQMEGRPLAETTFERLHLAPHVQRMVVRDHGFVGTLFLPTDGGPYPGVLLLGGAEGGLHEDDAALLAAHGYAVLALAYFGMEGVPPLLIDIPLNISRRPSRGWGSKRGCEATNSVP